MNPSKKLASIVFVLVLQAGHASAQSFAFTGGVVAGGLTIRDNDPTGLATSFHLSNPGTVIKSLTVNLEITGTFNGDLYAYLEHAGSFAVLLNRVGRTALNPDGYPDSGFGVSFVPSGGLGDIHDYRAILDPSGGAITGTWQADGRNVDPGVSLDTGPRTAGLHELIGTDPNGDWVLFVADLAPGGEGKLVGWSVQGVAVPEPSEWASMAGVALVGFALWRRWKR